MASTDALDAVGQHLYSQPVPPEMIGSAITEAVESLVHHERKVSRQAFLYAEKGQAFQCRSCQYAIPQNATHGRCVLVTGRIHLDEGCCVGWTPNVRLLHLYRTPEDDSPTDEQ